MCKLVVLLPAATFFAAFAQTPCEQLKSLSLPGAMITAAESIAAGPFHPSTNDAASLVCKAP